MPAKEDGNLLDGQYIHIIAPFDTCCRNVLILNQAEPNIIYRHGKRTSMYHNNIYAYIYRHDQSV